MAPDLNTAARKSSEDFTAGLLAAPVVAALVVAIPMSLALPQAAVLALLWRWYVVPAFAAPPIGLWAAFGLVLMARLLTTRKSPKDDATLWRSLAAQIGALGLILLLGWIGSFFV
jgi:hypothetical protein